MSKTVNSPELDSLIKTVGKEIEEFNRLSKAFDPKKPEDKKEEKPKAEGQAPEAKEGEQSPPATDGQADAAHAADEGANPAGVVQKLSPEEISALIEALQAELTARGGAPAGEAQPAPAPAEGAMDPAAQPPIDGAPAPAPMDPAAPPAVPGSEAAMAPASAHGGMDELSIEQHLAGLSAEELMCLEQCLATEKAQRSAPPPAAPVAPPAPPAAPAQDMSMFQKSLNQLEALTTRLEKLETASLNKSVVEEIEVPATTYADPAVRVLEKSQPSTAPAFKHNHPETLKKFLVDEIRKGNRKANSDMVFKANLIKSEEEFVEYMTMLKSRGLDV